MLHSKIIPINLFPVNLNGIFKGKWLHFPIEHTQLSEGTLAPTAVLTTSPAACFPVPGTPFHPSPPWW